METRRKRVTQNENPQIKLRKKSISPVREKSEVTKSEKKTTKSEIKSRTNIKIKSDKKITPKIVLSKISEDEIKSTKIIEVVEGIKQYKTEDVEVANITSFIGKEMTPLKSSNLTPTLTERSTESRQRSLSRSVSQSIFNDNESDNENEIIYEKFENESTRDRIYDRRTQSLTLNNDEFGGKFTSALFLLLIPFFCFIIQFSCTNTKSCTFDVKKLRAINSFDTFFNFEIGIIFFIFIWTMSLLSIIPMGRVIKMYEDFSVAEYYFNGLAHAVLTFIGIFVAEKYFNYPVFQIIYKNYLQICFISIIYSLILSVWCYIRSHYVSSFHLNPYGKTGKMIVDLFVGREISVKWFNVIDVKLVHYKISLIITLVLNATFIYKNVNFTKLPIDSSLSNVEIVIYLFNNVKYNQIALLTSSLIIIYIIDLLLNEHHLSSSFDLQREGLGAMLLLRYAIFPFMNSILSKFTLDFPTDNISPYYIAIICFFYFAGIILKRTSNKIKYEYRMNPLKLAYLDTLPTFQNRRLLITSWWNVVRHPNYLGDILSALSLLPLLYWNFALPPLVAVLSTVLMLVHRANRTDLRNSKRYNSAWLRYVSRVPNSLVPYVY